MRRILAVAVLFCMTSVRHAPAQTTKPSELKTDASNNFVYVGIESHAQFVVISPTGKKAGFENNARVTDIPFSATDEDCYEDAGKSESERVCSRRVEIGKPAGGEYRIVITSETAGLYNLWLACDLHGETSGSRYTKVVIATGEKHTYTFTFDESGRPIKLQRIKAR